MIRVRAGIAYALTQAMDEGRCGLPTCELVPLAAELLETQQERVETALNLEVSDGTSIADTVDGTACAFLGGLYWRMAPCRGLTSIQQRRCRGSSGRSA